MPKSDSRAVAETLRELARGREHVVPKPAPGFASSHLYEALVNGICYGYFSNAAAAADTVKYWTGRLPREQSLQCNLPPRTSQQKIDGPKRRCCR